MHDVDGASNQDIMFGHAMDETIAHSLTTSIGQDLTKTVTSGGCNQKARLDQRSRETYVKETAQTDLRSTSSTEVENASSG